MKAQSVPGPKSIGHPQLRRLHPAWLALVRHCEQVGHGEIERLKIQNGLPVIAETIRKKVKFT